MTKRIIFIIIGALSLALLVGFLWFWFFSGRGVPAPEPGASFGSAQNRPSAAGVNTSGQTTNIPSSVSGAGSTAGTSGGAGLNGPGTQGSIQAIQGVGQVPGVDWLGSSGSVGGVGGPTTSFVPKTINQLNTDSLGGTPSIVPTPGATSGSKGSGSDLGFAVGGILGAGVGCAAYAAFQGLGEGKAAGEAGTTALAGGFVLVYDWRAAAKANTTEFKNVGDCLARTIGRAVIQQMTNSIVNWINSGFNGKPSFVTNFQQYFTNVGDQAAGEFIRGTALSFLCSPFQLKIRIAIAQSYARRGAQSCTLTGVVKNVNRFLSGNFGQGGWAGLLQLTTIPTNNPYGAYAYAQIGLATAQSAAVNNANRNVTNGGFISLQKCDPPGSTKDCKVVTPGKVIESTLEKTLEQPYLANQLAQSFDQIVSALLNQLLTKTLYNGLSTLSGQNGYASDYLTPEQQQAQSVAQSMMQDLQQRARIAQQYGSVQQGAIQDIQNTQQGLAGLATCYSAKGQNTLASSTEQIIHNYNSQIDAYNNNITKANGAVAALENLQTQVLNVATPADVKAVQAAYQQLTASGKLITAADVTNAQQDRNTLQANLTNRNAQTQADLNQCNAS